MPRETIENRGGSFYARRDEDGQFAEMSEKGRSLKADRRTKAKTTVEPGQGDRGDQQPRAKRAASKKKAPAKKK